MELCDYNKKISNAENLILNSPYSEKNKELIFEFVNVLYAEGISSARIFLICNDLGSGNLIGFACHKFLQYFQVPP